MEVYLDIESIIRRENNVLTVGTFDGVHRGHRFILSSLKKRALARNAETTLVTFDTHPQIVLRKTNRPALHILTTIEEKLRLLRSQKIDNVVIIHFTEEFSRTNSEDFVRDILYKKIGCTEVVIGDDHAFGKNREGDVETLRTLGGELGFSVTELPAFEFEETRISSSKIRQLLKDGHVDEANRMLGWNYAFKGQVVKGDGRGKTLTFPTANLEVLPEDKLVPADGVYAVRAYLGDASYDGMMNIGSRPTFAPARHRIEVHLFDFSREIYGEQIEIEFIQRIRNEIRFPNADALIRQLERDKQSCVEALKNQEDIHAFNE